MSKFILAYKGGKQPDSPEEGAKHMAKWKTWVEDLGAAIVNPGTPLGKSKIVSSSDVVDSNDADRWSGYSVVQADNLDAAVAMAQSCPFLDMGTIEVAEMMEMKP